MQMSRMPRNCGARCTSPLGRPRPGERSLWSKRRWVVGSALRNKGSHGMSDNEGRMLAHARVAERTGLARAAHAALPLLLLLGAATAGAETDASFQLSAGFQDLPDYFPGYLG